MADLVDHDSLPERQGRRKRRVDKKLHRRWLADVAIDISISSNWRQRLFAAGAGECLPINTASCVGLGAGAQHAFRIYGLRYQVVKVDHAPDQPWLSQSGNVVFKFCALDYPSVCFYTGNNAEVS